MELCGLVVDYCDVLVLFKLILTAFIHCWGSLVSWCNAKFLQIYSNEETNSSTSLTAYKDEYIFRKCSFLGELILSVFNQVFNLVLFIFNILSSKLHLHSCQNKPKSLLCYNVLSLMCYLLNPFSLPGLVGLVRLWLWLSSHPSLPWKRWDGLH